MRFDEEDRIEGGEIEDRRGEVGGFPGGGFGMAGGGISLLGVVAFVLYKALGGSTRGAVEFGQEAEHFRRLPGQGGSQHAGSNPALTGSCAGVTSERDAARFIACVETNVQSFWRKEFARGGENYRPAKLVLFSEATVSGCGEASAATGPFYCPADQRVYLDLGFFDDLRRRFRAKGGDFAEAYVVAHEYGHHVQNLLRTEARVRSLQRAHPEQKNALSVRLELQADCYAGVWGHAAYERGKVLPGEIAQGLDAAASVGDDRIQKAARGRVDPERFTHGSAADRQKWFQKGMDVGDPDACDTFAP